MWLWKLQPSVIYILWMHLYENLWSAQLHPVVGPDQKATLHNVSHKYKYSNVNGFIFTVYVIEHIFYWVSLLSRNMTNSSPNGNLMRSYWGFAYLLFVTATAIKPDTSFWVDKKQNLQFVCFLVCLFGLCFSFN